MKKEKKKIHLAGHRLLVTFFKYASLVIICMILRTNTLVSWLLVTQRASQRVAHWQSPLGCDPLCGTTWHIRLLSSTISSRLTFSTNHWMSLWQQLPNVIPILSPHLFGKQETSSQRTQNPSLFPSAFISFLPRPRLRRPDIILGSYNVRPGRRPLSRYILCRSLFFLFFMEFRRVGGVNAPALGWGGDVFRRPMETRHLNTGYIPAPPTQYQI